MCDPPSIMGRPPSNLTKWSNLICETIKHCEARYGVAEVRSWRFESWNEPEYQFAQGNYSLLFPVYDSSVAGALRADSSVKVGGPSPANYDVYPNTITPFLNHCDASKIRVDFVSHHTWTDYWKTVDAHFWVLNELAKHPTIRTREVLNTECGPTWVFNLKPQPQETELGATWEADMVSQIAKRCHTESKPFPYCFSWWVVSDVFDEGKYYDSLPFPSCMGATSRQDIRKPIYNVFKMLNKMGTIFTSITTNPTTGTVNGMAASDSSNGVQALVYNADYTNSGNDNVAVTVDNITSSTGKVNYRCYLMDQTHSNAYTVWVNQGSPAMHTMTQANWNALRSAMNLATVDSTDSVQLTNNSFSRSYTLNRRGVMLISLIPTKPSTQVVTESAVVKVKPAFTIIVRTGSVAVSFALKESDNVAISLCDGSGRVVRTFLNEYRQAGSHTVRCNLATTKKAPNGIYFLKCRAGDCTTIQKIVLAH